ncbi:glycosyltransferase [Aequorivita sp. CIP111184]|uniref:glycosyltransferase n=1 Tax=Aequorivita sp. CIP111184 TaxID=2211356 RepID=UPI000DBBBB36|nr:glycosyltransferase [Aequorivita sp. CIP111184]SRX55336.1 Putative glycosyltransferase EpsH [Aequorivita sp. CIP111184]
MNRAINGVSVIICCHNSAKRLLDTLTYLAKQQIPIGFHWELILVNNNSSDDTTELAENIWKSLGSPTTLKIVNERKAGLSYAREKGMHEANYEFIIWCDDDNWLCDSYVQTAYEIMNANLSIGTLGGWCEAAFKSKKPDWFDTQAKYFAVSKQGNQNGDITNKKGCVYGAGMVLRKSHWHQLKKHGFKHLLSDRIGKKLSSGGDTEYCYALRLLGYKVWYDERLYFKHYMTTERLSIKYVSRIRHAMNESNFTLWAYLDLLQGRTQSRSDFMKEAIKDLPRLLVRKTGALLFGSFEQKEQAKRYFRLLKLRLFHYSEYRRNQESIKRWLAKN